MSRRSILLKGTLILTLTGLCTRVMGFFYRIFLSHTFGEEGMGIYQLVFPVYALGFSLTCAGIQTILSRLTAKNTALGKEKEARELLYSGLLITVFLSCIVTLLLQKYANSAAVNFLRDPRCEDLLILLSYVFPFAAVHSCICGYYFGRKETGIPAVSQLLEQSARIAGVLLIYHIGKSQGVSFQISLAVIGLILGELASSSFCNWAVAFESSFSALFRSKRPPILPPKNPPIIAAIRATISNFFVSLDMHLIVLLICFLRCINTLLNPISISLS